jgi:hypothetical protein
MPATVRRGYDVSDDPPSGALATPLIAAIQSGDPNTPFETNPTIE